jgi:REP-associated tyrosine transposase
MFLCNNAPAMKKKDTEPLNCELFYHIYNRGINGEDLFREEKNYPFFLKQYGKYIPLVAETYAYCLLKNHFHLLVRTKSTEKIIQNVTRQNPGRVPNPTGVSPDEFASKLISRQFGHLFNSYAQAVNKMYERTGSLFEEPFRRIPVESEMHCHGVISYIHTNAQKHKFVEDFRDYPHSSYHAFLSAAPTRLKMDEVPVWFGSLDAFVKFHLEKKEFLDLKKYEIEFD